MTSSDSGHIVKRLWQQGVNGDLQTGSGGGLLIDLECTKGPYAGRLGFRLGHASQYLVKEGQPVAIGQPIITQGCTGRCSGDHVHLQVHFLPNWERVTDRSITASIVNQYFQFVRQGHNPSIIGSNSENNSEAVDLATDQATLIEYFKEIALGSEYSVGDSGFIKKWIEPIHYQVHGSPTPEDKAVLKRHMRDLSKASGLEIIEVESDGNMNIHFSPTSEFARLEPNYRAENSGYAWISWSKGRITGANILISTDVGQHDRNSITLEEATQAMGLLQDSNKYSDSIFYQSGNPEGLSQLDWKVIELLYSFEIRAGMTEAQVEAVLRRRQ